MSSRYPERMWETARETASARAERLCSNTCVGMERSSGSDHPAMTRGADPALYPETITEDTCLLHPHSDLAPPSLSACSGYVTSEERVPRSAWSRLGSGQRPW